MGSTKYSSRLRRKKRIRTKVHGDSSRPRMTVFRSAKHIYAQVIDDARGHTVAFASTREKGFDKPGNKTEAAKAIGAAIAEACKQQGVERVVFDRNGYMYHGRVRALADAAREAGLNL